MLGVVGTETDVSADPLVALLGAQLAQRKEDPLFAQGVTQVLAALLQGELSSAQTLVRELAGPIPVLVSNIDPLRRDQAACVAAVDAYTQAATNLDDVTAVLDAATVQRAAEAALAAATAFRALGQRLSAMAAPPVLSS